MHLQTNNKQVKSKTAADELLKKVSFLVTDQQMFTIF